MTATHYTVHPLDVWGNPEDGYTVNNVYPSTGIITLDDNATDADIMRLLVDKFMMRKNGWDYGLVDVVGEDTLYIDYDGEPLFELRAFRLSEQKDEKAIDR